MSRPRGYATYRPQIRALELIGGVQDILNEYTAQLPLTLRQIEQYNLPTAPPKPTDRRAFDGLTTQCEALPLGVLAAIVREAIESRLNMRTYYDAVEYEEQCRREVKKRIRVINT